MEQSESAVIAVVLCVASAGAYATGALRQEQVAGHPIRRLVRTRGWWTALAITGLGGLLHVAALHYGPLALVQALGVLTLVLAVPMAAIVGRRRISRTEGASTVLAALSLCGLIILIGSTPAAALTVQQLAGLLHATVVILVLLAMLSRRRGTSGLPAAAAGGMAFGVASAVTQTLTVQMADAGLAALTSPIGVLAVLAVAGLTGTALCLTQLSYRHGLAAPLAVSTVTNPVAAAAIGILLLGEHLRGGAAGIVLATLCAAGIIVAVRQLTTANSPDSRNSTPTGDSRSSAPQADRSGRGPAAGVSGNRPSAGPARPISGSRRFQVRAGRKK